MDETTKKPDGTIQYEITKNGSTDKIFEYSEDVKSMGGGASQVTIEKLLPLKDLVPGQYTLKVKIVDKKRNQTVNQSAAFTIV
jgi:hypothetical protein